MTIESLFEILDIEDGSEFQFFESYAELMEADDLITADMMAEVLKGVNLAVFGDLTEEWFDEIISNLPDDAMGTYDILEAEKRYLLSLIPMAINGGEEGREALYRLWEELERFREWFTLGENAVIRDNKSGENRNTSISEAISEYRFAKLTGQNLDVDLSDGEDFIVNEYIVPLGELL